MVVASSSTSGPEKAPHPVIKPSPGGRGNKGRERDVDHRQTRLDAPKGRLSGLWVHPHTEPLCGVCIWPDGLSVLLCPREPCRQVWASSLGYLGAAESEYCRGARTGIAPTSRAALQGVHGFGH